MPGSGPEDASGLRSDRFRSHHNQAGGVEAGAARAAGTWVGLGGGDGDGDGAAAAEVSTRPPLGHSCRLILPLRTPLNSPYDSTQKEAGPPRRQSLR